MVASSEILVEIPELVKHITGERLKGIVKYTVNSDTVYKKVSLALVKKTWYVHEHKNLADYCTVPIRASDISSYESRKVLKIDLLQPNTYDGNVTVKAGSHEQLFEMKIPENIPPSVYITHGGILLAGITYYLILKFKKPEIFSMGEYFVTKLMIYPRIDSSSTDKPLVTKLEKTLTKLFSNKKHDIDVKVELDKEYLCPYVDRKISFTVANNSDVICSIKTELICKTHTKLKYGGSKEKTEVLATVQTPSIPDNSASTMFNVIPVGVDQYSVRHSKTISREYKIKVTLKLPAPHSNVFVEIPVIVGERIL